MDIAADDFSKAYTINPRNPVVTLGFAKWHFAKNNYTSAKEYIQSTKELDPNGVFEEQADELLKEIESMEANQMTGSGVLYDASESVQ